MNDEDSWSSNIKEDSDIYVVTEESITSNVNDEDSRTSNIKENLDTFTNKDGSSISNSNEDTYTSTKVEDSSNLNINKDIDTSAKLEDTNTSKNFNESNHILGATTSNNGEKNFSKNFFEIIWFFLFF